MIVAQAGKSKVRDYGRVWDLSGQVGARFAHRLEGRRKMMISPHYCQTMARYNAWQNAQLIDAVTPLDAEALLAERGAFFGSILGTLNHLLWGDGVWMARFSGGRRRKGAFPEARP